MKKEEYYFEVGQVVSGERALTALKYGCRLHVRVVPQCKRWLRKGRIHRSEGNSIGIRKWFNTNSRSIYVIEEVPTRDTPQEVNIHEVI